MSVAAVLTAAGSGSRLGHPLPKALVPLEGQSLVAHAARNLLAARAAGDDRVRVLVVTAPAFHLAAIERELSALGDEVTLLVVAGGATRQASVAAGLAALVADPRGADVDVVLVHDAARPLAPASLVERVIEAVRDGHPAVVPGLLVTDTIKRVAPHRGVLVEPVLETVPRAELRAIQTPQGFTRELLLRAHASGAAHAHDEALAASDDAGLVEQLGEPVWVVAGDERAAKITTARDLAIAALPTESAE
ncbi:2-C-methyl-D-erythritol 4-phosphate cytidylyltransferase [Cellulomonas sp. Root137]|uniref:2-C-methyl-D-erythritol 4-phosphate cytidylyltransferase n=1 Tax=Cellulomonas sp. Root137 TaxID=1736459 RepID=UPI0006F59041|nr:2-C-methyl-D-erythritol 4-phosphate cytidylyltransferase [Cellulomonas sp. Root137]KQY46022.1 2-C-methyl-D-erythritol 4-phosphate cytidylyltransferase [Cellulomonas sp. Root137]